MDSPKEISKRLGEFITNTVLKNTFFYTNYFELPDLKLMFEMHKKAIVYYIFSFRYLVLFL